MSRASLLLETKQAMDLHRFRSDPERMEALLRWTAQAAQTLLQIQVDAEGPPTPSAGEEKWYVGAQNDGLFIIDQPPRPSNDYINPDLHVNVVRAVSDIGLQAAQRICDEHNERNAPAPAAPSDRSDPQP